MKEKDRAPIDCWLNTGRHISLRVLRHGARWHGIDSWGDSANCYKGTAVWWVIKESKSKRKKVEIPVKEEGSTKQSEDDSVPVKKIKLEEK